MSNLYAAQAVLTTEHLIELQGMMTTHHLAPIYTLEAPV